MGAPTPTAAAAARGGTVGIRALGATLGTLADGDLTPPPGGRAPGRGVPPGPPTAGIAGPLAIFKPLNSSIIFFSSIFWSSVEVTSSLSSKLFFSSSWEMLFRVFSV